MTRSSKAVTAVVGLTLSLASILGLARLVERPAEAVSAVRAADLWLIALAALLLVSTYAARTLRWWKLLTAVAPVSRSTVLSGQAIGMLLNMLLPARGGDIARAVLMTRKTRISAATALGTVGAERFLDVLANGLIAVSLAAAGLLPALTMPTSNAATGIGWTAAAGVSVAVLGMIALRVGRRSPMVRRWFARLERIVRQVMSGFVALTDRRALGVAVFWSVMLWTLLGTFNYVLMLALGLRLPLHAAFVVLIAQTIGVAIPSSPGYVGTFHLANVLALTLYGIDAGLALSFALIAHLLGLFVALIIGLPFVWHEGAIVRALWRGGSQPAVTVA